MDIESSRKEEIKCFIAEGIDETIVLVHPDPFWKNLRNTGTEIWLDTGNIYYASLLWSSEMTALTSNNALLNKEVHRGIYDDYIAEAKALVKDLPLKQQIFEIAFILSARHGLRLVRKFGSLVSVELHTDLAHDYEGTVNYGLRLFEICPDNFLINVPFTATGLIAARYLGERGVRVILTLGFSARQNIFASFIAQPAYVNIFPGRLGAYIKSNGLGSDKGIGEHVTIAAQRVIRRIRSGLIQPTRLIAAGLQFVEQLNNLSGVDAIAIPVQIASDAHAELDGSFSPKVDQDYPVLINRKSDEVHIRKLWEVSENELMLANEFNNDPPGSGIELINRAHGSGCGDLFPILENLDLNRISAGGKIPLHHQWNQSIKDGKIAVDALLNLAGLEAFAMDQASLDKLINKILQQ